MATQPVPTFFAFSIASSIDFLAPIIPKESPRQQQQYPVFHVQF
ncbi:MAG: hypothetical protein R2727_07505 [Bacteroidales bacterium]